MARRNKRFTIFDAMDEKGIFDLNSANNTSPDFKGPVKYPMMFYHPQARERILVPAEVVMTPIGPRSVGEQREMIWKLAADAGEEAALRAAGWHDHPARAIAAAGGEAPAMGSTQRIEDLEAQIAKLRQELNDANALDSGTTRQHGQEVTSGLLKPQPPAA